MILLIQITHCNVNIHKFFLQKMEPTPTADLDRTNDKVYDCTTSVVRAVMSLSQGKNG